MYNYIYIYASTFVSLLYFCVIVCLCVCMCVCVCACVWGECVVCSSIVLVWELKLFTDLFTCQAYVQKGENDICDDGKEIAEAEDWESTVKENRVRT